MATFGIFITLMAGYIKASYTRTQMNTETDTNGTAKHSLDR